MNNVFRLVNPVYDIYIYIFKVTVFKKQANRFLLAALSSPA